MQYELYVIIESDIFISVFILIVTRVICSNYFYVNRFVTDKTADLFGITLQCPREQLVPQKYNVERHAVSFKINLIYLG